MRGFLALLLVAGGLVLALWATRGRAEQAATPTEMLLEGRGLANAERIVVRRDATAVPIHLARSSPGEPWMIVEPIVDLASAAFLESLRGVYDTASKALVAPLADLDAEQRRQMGVDQPRAFAEFRYPARTIAIAVGAEGPLGQDLFVVIDDRVYRCGLAVFSSLQVNPDDAREPRLLRHAPDQVRRVRMRRRGESGAVDEVAMERVADGYRLTAPLQCRAGYEAGQLLFSSLTGMQAERFLDGLNPMPAADVEIEVEGSLGVERLTVWQQESALIGHQEPRGIDFVIRSVDYRRLFAVPVAELRSRLLVPAVDRLARLEFEPAGGAGERLQLRVGVGGEMRLWEPVQRVAEPTPVNELLLALQQLRIEEFLEVGAQDLGRYGLAQGFATLTLHGEGWTSGPIQLRIGSDDGESTYVRRADEDYVAKVDKSTIDTIRRPWTSYPSLQVLEMPDGFGVTEVVVRRRESVAARYSRDAGVWQRDGDLEFDRGALREVVEVMLRLRGKTVLDGRDPAVAAAFAGGAATVELAQTAGDPFVRLIFADRGAEYPLLVRKAGEERLVFELGVLDSTAIGALLR